MRCDTYSLAHFECECRMLNHIAISDQKLWEKKLAGFIFSSWLFNEQDLFVCKEKLLQLKIQTMNLRFHFIDWYRCSFVEACRAWKPIIIDCYLSFELLKLGSLFAAFSTVLKLERLIAGHYLAKLNAFIFRRKFCTTKKKTNLLSLPSHFSIRL